MIQFDDEDQEGDTQPIEPPLRVRISGDDLDEANRQFRAIKQQFRLTGVFAGVHLQHWPRCCETDMEFFIAGGGWARASVGIRCPDCSRELAGRDKKIKGS